MSTKKVDRGKQVVKTGRRVKDELQELTILHTVSTAAAQAESVDGLFDTVTGILGRAVYVDDFGVALYDPARGVLLPHPSYRGRTTEVLESIPLGDGIVGHVGATGKLYNCPDVLKDAHYFAAIPETRSELCVPIKSGDVLLGVINAESWNTDFFTEREERLFTTIARTLATTIEKINLFHDQQARLQESETMREATAVVASTLDQSQAVKLILEQLLRVVPYDSASVLLMKGDHLEIIDGRGWEDASAVIGLRFPVPGNNPNTLVVQNRSPLVLNDAPEAYPLFRQAPHDRIRSWLGVPMIVRDRVIGVLTLDSFKPDTYSQEIVHLVTAFASQAAVAMDNAQSYTSALRSAERRTILHRASQEIAQVSQDPEQVYQAVHRAAEALMPAEAFVITLLDKERQETLGVYLVDKGGRWQVDHRPAQAGLSGLVIKTGKPVITNDLSADPIPGSVHFGEEDEVRSVLAVPLKLGGEVIGMLSAQSYQPGTYQPEDQAMLEELAAHAAVAIENARLYRETYRRMKELEAVNQLSMALRTAVSVDEITTSLMRETFKLIGTDSGMLWLVNRGEALLKRRAASGWCAGLDEATLSGSAGMINRAFVTGSEVSGGEDAPGQELDPGDGCFPPGWGGICMPIKAVEETIGVMVISVKLPRQLQTDEIHLVRTLLEMAGSAIRRAELTEQTERQLQRMASLRAVDMAINTILDLRVTMGILIDHIISQLQVDAVNLLLISPQSQTLYQAAATGFRGETMKEIRMNINSSLAGQAIRTRTTLHIPDLRVQGDSRQSLLLAGEGFITYFGVPLIAKGQVKGVLEILHRSPMTPDQEWMNFLETLGGQAAIAIDNSMLFEELQQTNMSLSLAYDATIEGWSKALDLRDEGTEGHTQRVTDMTIRLAEKMGLRSNDLLNIRRGALLHDIGKMGVPDSILLKAGSLTREEWEIMYQHPVFAHEMLSPISYLHQALDIPYCHHEHWDGSGYPRRLSGEQIPLAARIFAVVDVWDAIISNRPYRKAHSKRVAMEFIRRNSGRQFDPRVVEAFIQLIRSETGG